MAAKLQNAIKQKASFEELLEVLKEIPDEDGEQQTNPLRVWQEFSLVLFQKLFDAQTISNTSLSL